MREGVYKKMAKRKKTSKPEILEKEIKEVKEEVKEETKVEEKAETEIVPVLISEPEVISEPIVSIPSENEKPSSSENVPAKYRKFL
jgi:hypothetical protein